MISPNFYPRSPCGERPCGNAGIGSPISISIHALLAESDKGFATMECVGLYFYPRSPCGERPAVSKNKTAFSVFLSTLSLRRATSDSKARQATQAISIHALLAESDLTMADLGKRDIRFLSTLSLRRATHGVRVAKIDLAFLSTLSLRRATDFRGASL